jgi:hypothetical protein
MVTASVAEPYSFFADPDPGKNLNADPPDSGTWPTTAKKIQV